MALNIILIIWIGNALIRTLAYLKAKEQEYKLHVLKQFTMVIGAAILVNLLILFSMILYHMFSNKENVWQNDYFFRDCFGLVYMFTLMGVMMVFRPMEGAEMLVEVNEFLDETLTEVGPP